MDFAIFVLLNAVLFLRPDDLLPDLAGYRWYLLTIIPNILFALPKLLNLFSPHEISRRPITCCVLLLLVAHVASNLVRGQIDLAVESSGEFVKVVLYYLLAVAVLDTPQRLRNFLGWLGILTLVVASISLLDYNEYIRIESLKHIKQGHFDKTIGEDVLVVRMVGTGLFSDPNDLCLLVVMGSFSCCYRAATATSIVLRLLWLAPILVFGQAMLSTHSRGGMLALLAAVMGFFQARYGLKRAFIPFLLAAPMMLLLVGGRQSDINTGDTAHERMVLWANGLAELLRGPFSICFGIGSDTYIDRCGQVAHNSYIHSYVELGLLGGAMFLMAFWSAYQLVLARPAQAAAWTVPYRQYVLPILLGYAIGAYSLSRCYIVPTYLVLALMESYATLAGVRVPIYSTVDANWFRRAAIIGVGGLVFLKFFTQFGMAGL
jgi:putative inorganic carbon (hco3(-)) transporter